MEIFPNQDAVLLHCGMQQYVGFRPAPGFCMMNE